MLTYETLQSKVNVFLKLEHKISASMNDNTTAKRQVAQLKTVPVTPPLVFGRHTCSLASRLHPDGE